MTTIEEIDAQLAELGQQKDATREKMRELSELRTELVAEHTAKEKAARMSPAERKALGIPEPTVVGAKGIESQEASGEAAT